MAWAMCVHPLRATAGIKKRYRDSVTRPKPILGYNILNRFNAFMRAVIHNPLAGQYSVSNKTHTRLLNKCVPRKVACFLKTVRQRADLFLFNFIYPTFNFTCRRESLGLPIGGGGVSGK